MLPESHLRQLRDTAEEKRKEKGEREKFEALVPLARKPHLVYRWDIRA
jgi:hypothetical protein